MWIINMKNFWFWLMLWSLYMTKLLLINPFVMSFKSNCLFLFSIIIFFQIRMGWLLWDNRNFLFKLKTEMGLCHAVLINPKNSSEKITLNLVEIKQLPDIEETYSKEVFFCRKMTTHNGRRNVCINYQTDTDKLNTVVYHYGNNIYLKIWEWNKKRQNINNVF